MAGIVRGHTDKTQHNGMIWGVYVRTGDRRDGIGGQLTDACSQWARERGVDIIRLGVNSANVAAIRRYAACGFQVCGLSPRALRYDGKDYDELMMVRELNRS